MSAKRIVRLTPRLRERAAKLRDSRSGGATISHGKHIRVEVLFRPFEDIYTFWDKDSGEVLASVTDSSIKGKKEFSIVVIKQDVALILSR